MPAQHIFFNNNSPVPGGEQEYEERWVTHSTEVIDNIDGFVAVQRYRLAEKQRPWSAPAQWLRHNIYELEGDDVDAIHTDNTRVREQGIYSPFAHLVAPGNMGHVYTPFGQPYRSEGWEGRLGSPNILLARSNPTEGNEDAYNEWYEIHMRETVDLIDGFRGCQRYRLNASQRPGMRQSPWDYLAIYEIDDTDLDTVYASNAALLADRDRLLTPGNETLMRDDAISHILTAVGPRLIAAAG